MENAKIYLYDGSFNGFLTAIFVAFARNEAVVDFRPDNGCQNTLFLETETILTHLDYAKRVWNGIEAKSAVAVKQVYFSFLSEHSGIEQMLYRYIRNLFHNGSGSLTIPCDHIDMKISQLANQVAKEKGKLEANLKFEASFDNIQYSLIAPNFNVLPLLSKHFRFRFPEQEWIIFDYKRKYGLHSNGKSNEFINLKLKVFKTERFVVAGNSPETNADLKEYWKTALKGLPLKSKIVPFVFPGIGSNAKSDFFGARKAV